MRSSSLRLWTLAGATVVLIAGGAAAWLFAERHQPPRVALPSAAPRAGALPVMWAAPQFSFPDQDDAAVNTQSLAGKVWIVDFIFTHCGNTCPRMTARRVELQKQIPDARVMFLSISVDPERDDRTTRKTYAAEKGVNESRWKFVGPPDKAAALKIAQQMKVAALTGARPGDEPILHSDRFVLLDAQSRIRGIYPLDDEPAMQRLVNDATLLAKEIRN
jgi:protein SCO1/2